jgi:hypothetical protein
LLSFLTFVAQVGPQAASATDTFPTAEIPAVSSTNRAFRARMIRLRRWFFVGHHADGVMIADGWRVVDGERVGLDLAALLAEHQQAARDFA